MELRKYLYICGVEMQQEVSRCSGLGAMMAILTKGQVAWAACLFGMDSRGGGREARNARNVIIFGRLQNIVLLFLLGIGLPDWVDRCPFSAFVER